MDKSAVEWTRSNDPKDDPIIQNPEKKQSLFINAFQVNEKIMIVTKYRYLVYDTNLKAEVKAMNFSELGSNAEIAKVFSFNKSYNMMKQIEEAE